MVLYSTCLISGAKPRKEEATREILRTYLVRGVVLYLPYLRRAMPSNEEATRKILRTYLVRGAAFVLALSPARQAQ